MKLFIWRHNRKYHSWSMMDEPCVHNTLYTDAIAIVAAESVEQALTLLAASNEGWRVQELGKLDPIEYNLTEPAILFSEVRGE